MAKKGAAFLNIVSAFNSQGLKDAQKGFDSLGSRLKSFGKAAGVAIAAATAAVAAFAVKLGVDSVKAASDFNETLSKSEVIFGKAASEVQKFADQAASALGQSKTQALDAASTFAVFGKSAGLAGSDLAKFSIDFTSLASDLASFNNTSPEEAITAIGAALRGESEPIRRYGVLLDDASMRQKALELGIISTTKQALTPQQKVLAAQALIFEQTSDAQGDFARTSSGLANQQRILTAEFENIKIELGQQLLPVVVRLANIFTKDVLPTIKKVASAVGDQLQPVFEAVAPVIESLFNKFGEVASTGNSFSNTFKVIGDAVQDVWEYFQDFIPILQDFWKQIQARIVPALQELGNIFVKDVLPSVKAFFDFIKPALVFFANIIKDAVLGALDGLIQAVKGVLKVFSGLLDFITGIFTGDWSRAWNGVKNIFTGLVDFLIGAVKFLWNMGILKAFNLGWNALKGLVTKGWEAVKKLFADGVKAVVNWFKNLPKTFVETAKALRSKLIEIGKNIIQGLINGMKNAIPLIVESIKNIGTSIVDGVKNFFGISSPSKLMEQFGVWITEGLTNGIAKGFDNDKFKAGMSKFLDKAQGEFERAKQAFDAFRDEVRAVILDAIDFGAAIEEATAAQESAAEGGEAVGTTFLEALQKQAEKAIAFAEKVAELIKLGLSKSALKEVLKAGVDSGTLIADELIKGGSTAINKTNELVDATKRAADKVSKFAADSYYGAGLETARKMVKAFKEYIKEGGEGWKELMKEMDKLAKKLERTVVLKVKAESSTSTGTSSTTSKGLPTASPSPTINITVNGALDAESTARQIENILKRSQLRAGAYS